MKTEIDDDTGGKMLKCEPNSRKQEVIFVTSQVIKDEGVRCNYAIQHLPKGKMWRYGRRILCFLVQISIVTVVSASSEFRNSSPRNSEKHGHFGRLNDPKDTTNNSDDDLIRLPLFQYPLIDSIFNETFHDSRKLGGVEEGHGTHFVTVFIGNPAQTRTLAVSTNSHYTAFPCKECDGCTHKEADHKHTIPFDYGKSDTFHSIACGQCLYTTVNDAGNKCDDKKSLCLLSDMNRDMSMWEAFQAKDFVYIGGADLPHNFVYENSNVAKEHGFPLTFGCQTLMRGWFESEVADGIMGMSSSRSSFIYQMYNQNKLKRPIFSLCFEKKSDLKAEPIKGSDDDDTTGKGALTLGGSDKRYHNTPMVYASNVRRQSKSKYSGAYALEVTKIYLRVGGGQSVVPDVPGMKIVPVTFDPKLINSNDDTGIGGVFLESGYPFTIFSRELREPFKQAWKRATGREFSYRKMKLTYQEIHSMPTILLQLTGHVADGLKHAAADTPGLAIDLDPENPHDILVAFPATHWLEYNPHTDMYRPRISFENEWPESILGANFMKGHDVTYDIMSNRIGFAESKTCDLTAEVLELEQENVEIYNDDLFDLSNMDEFDDDSENNPWGMEDDIFNNMNNLQNENNRVIGKGLCDTMTCKSFVGVGYFFLLVTGWVIWKCANIKKTVTWNDDADMDHVRELEGIDFPDYEPEDDRFADEEIRPLSAFRR